MNIITLILKPALRRKFELEQIFSVLFKANTIEDTLILEGKGIDKKGNEINVTCEPLKLTENKQYLDIFEQNLKTNGLIYSSLNVIYMNIDFSNKKINTEVYYTNIEGKKLKQNLTQKL